MGRGIPDRDTACLSYLSRQQRSCLVRDGLDACLQLKALAEASLEVLRGPEAPETASDHNADALAERLALFHAGNRTRRNDCCWNHILDSSPSIENGWFAVNNKCLVHG